MVVEELGQALDQAQVGHLRQRYPGRLTGIVARRGLHHVERRHREVEDDVVVVLVDAFHPPQEAVADHLQSGLLGHLPYDGFGQGLAGLDASTGNAPEAGRRPSSAAHEQQPLGIDGYGPDAHLRHVAPVAQADSIRWCITSSLAVNPHSSKKFLVARIPGSATASTPQHPHELNHSSNSSIMASPTPIPRASGWT